MQKIEERILGIKNKKKDLSISMKEMLIAKKIQAYNIWKIGDTMKIPNQLYFTPFRMTTPVTAHANKNME